MKLTIFILLLLFLHAPIANAADPSGCNNYYCSDYDWRHGLKRFDPHTIHYPLHHTGEIYKDKSDGGHHQIDVVWKTSHGIIKRTSLEEFRKHHKEDYSDFLKDGLAMEPYHDCDDGYRHTGKPSWKDTPCSMVGESYEDQLVYFDASACVKKIRHWTVVDWCKYVPNYGKDKDDDQIVLVKDLVKHTAYFSYKDHPSAIDHDGYYSFTQVIKVIDDSKPVLKECKDIIFELTGDCEGNVVLENKVLDEGPCSSSKVDVVLEVYDDYGYLVSKKSKEVPTHKIFQIETGYLVAGEYHLYWKVTDGCHNYYHCSQKLTVEDTASPELLCIQNLSTSVSDDYGVTVWASDFVLKAKDACDPDDEVSISFSPDELVNNVHFDCSSTFGYNELLLYATDRRGNQTACYVELFVSDHHDCSDEMQISGHVFNRFSTPLKEVSVDIKRAGEMVATGSTDNRGKYLVGGIPVNKSYSFIEPHIQEDRKAGLDAIDLVLLLRHITGFQKFKEVMDYAAGDVNSDAAIDMSDYWDLATVIYDLPNRAAAFKPWKFIDSKLFYAGVNKASKLTAPVAVRTHRGRYDLIGLKAGDINFSWGRDLKSAEEEEIIMDYADILEEGTRRLEFSPVSNEKIGAIQLVIDERVPAQEIVVSSDYFNPAAQFIRYEGSQTIIHLVNTDETKGDYGHFLSIVLPTHYTADVLPSPSVVQRGTEFQMTRMVFNRVSDGHSSKSLSDVMVFPNPAREVIRLEWQQPGDDQVLLRLIDQGGREVHRASMFLREGRQVWELTLPEYLTPGLYFVALQPVSGKQPLIRRFIRE